MTFVEIYCLISPVVVLVVIGFGGLWIANHT